MRSGAPAVMPAIKPRANRYSGGCVFGVGNKARPGGALFFCATALASAAVAGSVSYDQVILSNRSRALCSVIFQSAGMLE